MRLLADGKFTSESAAQLKLRQDFYALPPHLTLRATMLWPAHIVARSSRLLDTETVENKFYGLYNSILNECFPSTHFTVTPQYPTAEAATGGIGAICFAITFVVEPLDLESPIFFVEIKTPTHLPS